MRPKEALARRETSSVEIVRARSHGAAMLMVGCRCLIARMDQQALELAESADRERKAASTPENLPLLHGLPMTVKDNIEVAGTDATLGVLSRVGRASEKRRTRGFGASPGRRDHSGKTNVPQLLLVQRDLTTPSLASRAIRGTAVARGRLQWWRGCGLGLGADAAGYRL